MVWRPTRPLRPPPLHHIGASPVHAVPPRTGTWEWSGRSARGRPPHPPTPPGGGWRRAGRCSQLLSDAKHPQHPRNGFWLGRNPLKKYPLELHIKSRGLYTSSLGIHCAVSVQGVRQGVNQEVRLKARKVRVMRWGVLVTTFTCCAQLLLAPSNLTTRLSGSGRGAGIRSFITCLNITSAAHPEHGSRRPGRYSI
jgi:hypothetical protein